MDWLPIGIGVAIVSPALNILAPKQRPLGWTLMLAGIAIMGYGIFGKNAPIPPAPPSAAAVPKPNAISPENKAKMDDALHAFLQEGEEIQTAWATVPSKAKQRVKDHIFYQIQPWYGETYAYLNTGSPEMAKEFYAIPDYGPADVKLMDTRIKVLKKLIDELEKK